MIRLYTFNNASRAAGYGIGTYISQLTDGLSVYAEVAVSFVDMFADTKEFSVTKDEQGRIHYLIPSLSIGMESEVYCRSVFYLLARNIKNGDTDQLVFHFNYFQHKPLAMLLKGQYPECRIILTVHYMSWCFELNGNLTRLREIMSVNEEGEDEDKKARSVRDSVREESVFLHLADEVVALSRKTMEVLTEDYKVSKDKLHLIYNGTGTESIGSKSETDTRNILFVGRLDEIKGLKYLIEAFAKIASRHPEIRLVIVGDGEFQPYLSQCRKSRGKVAFLGKMQSEDLERVYQSAYIGVAPSFHEQCSYTVIEMMRHGIPVIGTDSTGLVEMLDATPDLRIHINEENFSEEDFIGQLASCLDLLLSDKGAYTQASEAVTSLYEERYKSDTMVSNMINIVKASFERPDYLLPIDFLPHIDTRMMQLINQSPDISTDFFGMSGIGVYLWWRVLTMGNASENEFQSTLLQEYLLYYMDWLCEAADNSLLPDEMLAALNSMTRHGFYKTRVNALLSIPSFRHSATYCAMPPAKAILRNALKICNCKV